MRYFTQLIYAAVAASLLLTATILVAPMSITDGFKIFQPAQAQVVPAAEFDTTDQPGSWFENTAGGGSLAIVSPGDTVRFTIGSNTNTVHTVTSLLWPSEASDVFPYDSGAFKGDSVDITLPDAGLYVFVCKLHPFMLAAVIADDPETVDDKGTKKKKDDTPRYDLGQDITLIFDQGNPIPTASDLALRLLRAFFVITTPTNWQDFSGNGFWNPSYPAVPVLAYDEDGNPVEIDDLDAFLGSYFGEGENGIPLPSVFNPDTPGVGEVWVDTQYELTENKEKPGTVTKVDVTNWEVKRKVALPEINMNNPHNMWASQNQNLIYQTQWFDNKLTTFNRETGELVANVVVGEAPAHVMTRVDVDTVHVSLNGGDTVAEVKPNGKSVIRQIPVSFAGEDDPLPHAHWMSYDGQTMVTPNANTADSTIYDFGDDTFSKVDVGILPIASGMMPDASKYYVSNFLSSTISVINLEEPNVGDVITTINLLADYDPIPLDGTNFSDGDGNGVIAVGALPIQTPVSPDGRYVVTANTLTNTITIIDTETDELIKSLACDAGCHGVNFGAKQGGGYYAYVSSKFANTLLVVDINEDESADTHLTVVGRIVLDATESTATDDTIIDDDAYKGMGGQGVLPVPLVYNGWVQELPGTWKNQLTEDQQNPIG
jgi:DNA-binding beta-propeller fold protein YncE